MAKKEISEAEKKVANAEKAAKQTEKKANPNGNFFQRASKAVKKFFKDLKGEVKKIVWPDKTTVLKSTGVVLLVVAICAIVIFGIDELLSLLFRLLKNAVQGMGGSKEAEEAVTAAMMSIGRFFAL